MDAIYYLSFCKSFLNSIDGQNIRFDQEFFMIQGKYIRLDSEETIYCGLKRGQKKIFRRNQKEYKKLRPNGTTARPQLILVIAEIGIPAQRIQSGFNQVLDKPDFQLTAAVKHLLNILLKLHFRMNQIVT